MFIEVIQKGKSHLSSEILTNEQCNIWTGWSRDNIDAMTYYVYCRNNVVRSKRLALLLFWIKLNTNLAFSQKTSLFDLGSGDSGRTVKW